MQIALKHSNTHWIDCEGFKLKIDYPDFSQQEKLEELYYSAWGNAVIDEAGGINKRELNIAKYLKYKRYYLKYTLKDWEGIAEDGKEIKFLLDGNEMQTEQWQQIFSDPLLTTKFFDIIEPETQWTVADKKKLNSPES